MFKNRKIKSLEVFLFFIFFFVLISVARFTFDINKGEQKKWLGRNFGGMITEKNLDTILVKDGRGQVKSFEVGSSTKIFSGKEQLLKENLQVGEFVIVESDALLKNAIDLYNAKSIRILDDKHKIDYGSNF
jgi:hypothetical protein